MCECGKKNGGLKAALWSLSIAVVLQLFTFAFFAGKLTSRVENIEKSTDVLLQMHLQKSASEK